MSTKIWKFNQVTGYWEFVRECIGGTEDAWLKIFQKDEPSQKFKVSKNKPRI